MRIFTSIFMAFLCSISFAQQIELQTFATGFNNPINIKSAGDSRLFVVEQAGFIQIIYTDASRNSAAFLDINSIVINGGGERGLLGLAFHPNYASNGYFYVNYINNSGNTVISRFSRSTTNPDIADNTSELQILTFTQPYGNHNGGDMAFGADGFLYISSGDGGASGDPENRAQNLGTLLGKMLRIDVDNTSNGNNYAIPTDNPYFGSTSAMPEIWAYGLRNAWKFSFDRSTNDLWIADVGQNVREEINMVSSTAAGLNYGWKCYEGNSIFDNTGCPPAANLTFPIAQYTHNGNGAFKCSITGGYRYRGTAQPDLVGLYFFADYCSDEIGILEQSGANWNMTFTQAFTGNGWTTFGEDNNGEIYIAGIDSDTVYKIVGTNNLSVDDTNAFNVKLFPIPVEDLLTLDISNSTMVVESVNIYNIQGKVISSYKQFDSQLITISTKELTTGMYFVEITNTQGNSVVKKLIKN